MSLPVCSWGIYTTKIINIDNQSSLLAAHHVLNQLGINSITVLATYKVKKPSLE